MGDVTTLQTEGYQRLPDAGDDSHFSDESDASPLLKRVFEEHGYTKIEQLGRGVSGIVYLVTDKAGDSYVIKQMNSRDRRELHAVQLEVVILKKMNCGYIVSYVESFEDKATGLFYIVMEYCAGGDLYKRMQTQANEGFFAEQQILDWFVQICLALQYLHDERKKVFHRDIKPQNIFLTEDDYINLGDFGYSKVYRRADPYSNSVVGAELYVSPEGYQKKYNSQSDIWSLGWLLYDLCMLDVWRVHAALHSKPGGSDILKEYEQTKSLSDKTRKKLVNILVADMVEKYGRIPPVSIRVSYALGIVTLFPNLKDKCSSTGYEQYYDPRNGQGYIAYRLKTVQRNSVNNLKGASKVVYQDGPKTLRETSSTTEQLSGDECTEAISMMKHSTDAPVIKDKMKTTFKYRQNLMHDPDKSSLLSPFINTRFLDTLGLIDQYFTMFFGEDISSKFIAKWPTF